ncbi:MAG: ABC transporter permease, partial [Gemmatimonadaceae bacterium]
METVLQDFRFAGRLLRKTPIFTAVAVVLVAFGTASVTTIFSAVEGVLLGTGTGIDAPGAMVDVSSADPRNGDFEPESYPAYRDLRDRTRTLDGLAAYAVMRADVEVSSGAQRQATLGLLVSGNYFQVLRVRPVIGRFIRPDEDATAMGATVAVLGYDYWRTRFAGDRGVVGRTIGIDGIPFTVIGVAPSGFTGTVAFMRPGVFVPITTAPVTQRRDFDLIGNRHSYWLSLVGRLRPDAARAAAQSELARIAGDIAVEHGGRRSDATMRVAPLRAVPAEVVGPVSVFMSALMAVAALVLLIGSLNVAGMLLAQGVERRREFLVRLAVGATRARLVRQLLTESLFLFAVGGAVGVL